MYNEMARRPDLLFDYDSMDEDFKRTYELDETILKRTADKIRCIGDDINKRYPEPLLDIDKLDTRDVKDVVKDTVKDILLLVIKGMHILYQYKDMLP